MIRLINVSGRKIDIDKNVSIPPDQSITGDITITPRIEQLINTGLLSKVEQIYEKKDFSNQSFVSPSDMRRQRVLEEIKAGNVNPSVNVEKITINEINNTDETNNNQSTSKRGRKKSNN